MGHNRSYKPEDIRFPDQVITESNLVDEMEKSYIEYAMSVIVGRALPDVRDGLKPVHRRILYTMYESGLTSDKPFKKSATCVGDVLGKYHPHGDASVYDAMVRLAQDFSLRYPLVDGQGNFGSVDGDPPAAYRYTEARMSRMAVEMLTDIEKDTIDWDPNFDETKKEPSVLPCRFPNLLVNGSQGIAVGMATNIPPHNLSEVIDGCIAYIDNPDIDLPGLMEYIKGPDFPTAGIIMGRSGIRAAYATGRGKITLRGRATIEETKNGRTQIIITEIPYMVNKARLIENMADLVKEKRIEGITGLNDETNRKGMRIVVDIRKDANAQVILNQLYQYTQLQDTVGVIMLAIDHKVPKVLTLKQMLQKYVEFQDEVVRRRTQYDLKKAKERAHILEGLKKATDIVDELIATIRACKGGMAEAKAAIMEQFGFDDPQADAIVKLQLGRLAGLEILKIEEELASLQAKIENWEAILADDARVLAIVKEELLEMKKRFGDERRTEIQSVTGEVDIEDLIAEEQCVYTLTEAGYIKRQLKATYQAQRRGGRGISGMTRKEEDIVQEMFVGSTHDYVLFVTDRGRLFRIKGYTIAEGSRTSKGMNIVNLLQLAEGEKVTNMICQSKDAEQSGGYVTMVTKQAGTNPPPRMCMSGAETRRALGEDDWPLLVINTPLSDESGIDLAIDAASHTATSVLMLVKAELADQVQAQLENYGVFVVAKPVARPLFDQAIRYAAVLRNRLMTVCAEKAKLEKKLADVRVVDRAKCLLIQYRGLTEEQAHRALEKQAMDTRQTRVAVAQTVIDHYDE